MERDGIWIESWKIPAFMVDADQQIKHRSIADIFQELANNHANYRKVGFEDMKALGKFWVLNRQAIQIDQWPMWEEQVQVESWISMMKGPFSLRNFAIFNTNGDTMVRASYLWTSIDRKKMRPVAFPEGDFPIIHKRSFELPEPAKFKSSDSKPEKEYSFHVHTSDLDVIGHTNNAVYLEWASDCLIGEERKYTLIVGNYLGESFEGETIKVSKFVSENSILLSLKNVKEKEICRFKLESM